MKFTQKIAVDPKLLKILSTFLLIVFPLLGFYLGVKYQRSKPPDVKYIVKNKIVEVFPTEEPRDLINRCGKIPSEKLGYSKGHFTQIVGPVWSPDCRYIAWSVWESGTGWWGSGAEGMSYEGPYPHEGVFLYNDRTGQIRKISINGGFKHWKNSKEVIFAEDSGEKIYDVELEISIDI